jgi:hypothetical protein
MKAEREMREEDTQKQTPQWEQQREEGWIMPFAFFLFITRGDPEALCL